MLWVLKRTVSMRRFFWAPKTYVQTDGLENIYNFTLKNYFYLNLWKMYINVGIFFISPRKWAWGDLMSILKTCFLSEMIKSLFDDTNQEPNKQPGLLRKLQY